MTPLFPSLFEQVIFWGILVLYLGVVVGRMVADGAARAALDPFRYHISITRATRATGRLPQAQQVPGPGGAARPGLHRPE